MPTSTMKEDSNSNNKSQIVVQTFGILAVVFLVEGFIQYWRTNQIQQLNYEIQDLKSRIEMIEYLDVDGRSVKRVRRQLDSNLIEDSLPIRPGSYKDNKQGGDTEGLRIYENWFQHKTSYEIPKGRRGSRRRKTKNKVEDAIKPHHRTSASWVERRKKSNHNLNAHFDDKVVRERYPSNRNTNSGQAIDMPQTNFYKMTPTEEPIESTPGPVSQLPMKRYFYQVQNETENSITSAPRSRPSNRYLLRSGGNRQHHRKQLKNMIPEEVSSISDQFKGLKAIHYVGELGKKLHDPNVYQGEGNQQNDDGVFRSWAPARWATRMRFTEDFPLDKDGRISVKKSGLYYIYAQVNYLDEHDVNAYQVFINEDPYLLCTTMTHTRHSTTKANTCFTSGVAFLEAEDQILVRDLEPMRTSVIRPSHTFFGLIQLSSN